MSDTLAVVVDGADPSPWVDFVAGTVGGVASLLAGHPFDTIKTRLQAQTPSSHHHGVVTPSSPSIQEPLLTAARRTSSPPPQYVSAFDALRRIVAEERFVGLYKGITSPMLGVAVMNASIFGAYGLALRTLSRSQQQNDVDTPTLSNIFLAGCASGIVSALITSPIELVKIRQQLTYDNGGPSGGKTPSTWTVARSIWQRGGVRGVYRGLGCTCLRDLGYGPYFLSYEVMNRLLLSMHNGDTTATTTTTKRLSNVEMALSGGIAGVLAWLSTFGIDVIKTRVQATDRRPTDEGKSAFLYAARQTYRQGGWRAFFAGVGPTVLRALPVNAVLFLSFEATKDVLMKMGY